MRISTVCCARTPNLEIAIFSGDFVTAGGALLGAAKTVSAKQTEGCLLTPLRRLRRQLP